MPYGQERSVICDPLRLLGQVTMNTFTDQPPEPAIPLSRSSWPFFKFTARKIEDEPV